MTVNILNIGCFKNLVDSERLAGRLLAAGVEVVFGRSDAPCDVAIVNTCGFISDAEEDSMTELRAFAAARRQGRVGQLWVMGCLGQKKGDGLRLAVPEIDQVYGNFDWHAIVADLCGSHWSDSNTRMLTTPGHYAYVKISEGCDMACAYCIKPVLNGPLRSVPMEDIVAECRSLARLGVKELQIVSQNTTSYGTDLYGFKRIAELTERLADIDGIEWIRLHYAYPPGFPRELLRVMASRTNVCAYLDMAIQHCNPEMLRLMRRPMSKERLEGLLDDIRAAVPGITLRTTVMTGHPGETPEMFAELCAFVERQRFGRMGVFPYSHEAMSYSGRHYADSVPEDVKRSRALELMAIQRRIYDEDNRALVGRRVRVVVDKRRADGVYEARPENSTPMADPKVLLHSAANLCPGTFCDVTITESLGKDMKATL